MPMKTLQRFVEAHGTQKVAARALGITPGYLNDLLHRRRTFSARLLRKLGFKRIIVASVDGARGPRRRTTRKKGNSK